jgi:Family of unknown function (DUF5906)
MDFYRFRTKEHKNGTTELYPGFVVGRSTDLMIRGGKFYAVWDEEAGMWSTDEYDVARLVDVELYAEANDPKHTGRMMVVRAMTEFESTSWSQFQKYISQIQDNSVLLDQSLTFVNTDVKKSDYVSKRLPYALAPGDHSAWDELVGTLYSVEERAKIEWIIGAIVSGDSKKIQKFGVFYGPPGSGKGTVMDIMHKMFEGYTTTFEAKQLGSANDNFALEVFRNYPLVAIQGDGNLSRIADNARLNSITAHEPMTINTKFKSAVTDRIHAFLVMGTNKPVQITDAKSGLIRRLIDIHPTGIKIPTNHYLTLVSRTDFELGAIAHHCLTVYREMGKNYYEGYRPLEMMLQTDPFFNFIEYNFDIFKEMDGVSLTQAYTMYKEYCEDAKEPRPLTRQKFQHELRNYFEDFKDRTEVDGHQVRNYYRGFSANKFKEPAKDGPTFSLAVDDDASLLDEALADMPAQYARQLPDGGYIPEKYWDDDERLINGEMKHPEPRQVCSTILSDLDTSKLHYVLVPENHIVIDFDLKDEDGNKSLEMNLQAASNWPPTYAELSQGGNGVHLHYIYEGDVHQLASVHSNGVEIKTLLGNASLRRRVSKCNSVPIATMNGGLPLKEKKMLDKKQMSSEKTVRDMIAKNLDKGYVSGTKSSVDFIKKILDDAYASGMSYDVSDLKGPVMAFAANSSNQKLQALKVVTQMKWKSDDMANPMLEPETAGDDDDKLENATDDRLVFYDVEVFPNLFVVCWKYQGSDVVTKMINPTSREIEALLQLRLVGFFNRRYDNHILYAAYIGYSVEALYKLSQKIVTHKDGQSMFGEAYGLSYADIWDFASSKQSLKKWQIDLGLPHVELDIPWDQPVPDELIPQVVDYCVNDVNSTEAVFEDRRQDFVARQILADLSGLQVNDTTQRHTARIIFGTDRHPQASFLHPDLAEEFPGYTFDQMRRPASEYMGEDPSEGGYVFEKVGMYHDVDVFDVASMHPTSIVQLNAFGQYTPRFKDLLDARVAIKRKNYAEARKMLDGKLSPYLEDPKDAKQLSYALKIVINIVYGLTSAKFDNPFRDHNNRDNVVAKRGALFMIRLKNELLERGVEVVHIKTDSIKVVNATDEIRKFIFEFGEGYGYEFEHEATYDKFCLVNKAVYIAHYGWAADEDLIGKWDATGAQFQQPYVFKKLFSGEEIVFDDLCVTKEVQGSAMYLNFEHDKPEIGPKETMKFIGRTGRFVPVTEDQGGAMLLRFKDDKGTKVTGTSGYLWLEADVAKKVDAKINMAYFDKLMDDAIAALEKHGDAEEFCERRF